MRADVHPSEDTTTLYLRFEIIPEGREKALLDRLGGPLTVVIEARDYVDAAGKRFERTDVEVPIYPHLGQRNFGQARFTSHEARRAFQEALQEVVLGRVTNFVHDTDLAAVPVEGHAIRVGTTADSNS